MAGQRPGERLERLRTLVGLELDAPSGRDQLVGAIGGLLAVLVAVAVNRDLLGLQGPAVLVPSAGASAVLVFGLPHAPLSQPWPVAAGQAVSAAVGVTCAVLLRGTILPAACAVGGAIAVMRLLRCVHPPGGATALTAVLGGPAVRDLGYGFVLRPVLCNVAVLLVVGVVVGALFPWRHYPAGLRRRAPGPAGQAVAPVDARPGAGHGTGPSRERILEAVRSLESFVDVGEDDLRRLVHLLGEAGPQPGDGHTPGR